MFRLVSRLVIYRNISKDSILFCLSDICRDFESGSYDKNDLTGRILDQINRLLSLATSYGFDKDLWNNYIAWLIAMTENPFTIVCEKNGKTEGSVNDLAIGDFEVFFNLLNYDFSMMEKILDLNCFSLIRSYKAVAKKEQFYNKNVSARVQELGLSLEKAASPEEIFSCVMDFYQKYGVGSFGMNKAFRIESAEPFNIVPIIFAGNVVLSDLVGYEAQKQELVKNTEAFLLGLPANNVLLYGDAGTGKSTSIKALLNMYYEQGLRIIEIYKHDLRYLPGIISIIKNRNYRFIIYMDDLSFESAETDYKYLKAVIEGDLEIKPENVLIYATSNRRHLIRETFSDRLEINENDVHKNDTMAERLSLAGRFGVSIGYFKPDRAEYHNIVKALAAKHHDITVSTEELLDQADRFALRRGELSGRTAAQFITSIIVSAAYKDAP